MFELIGEILGTAIESVIELICLEDIEYLAAFLLIVTTIIVVCLSTC